MTLCIASLCDHGNGMAICFDREIQTDIAKAQTGFKLVVLPSRWQALQAGSLHRTKELTDLYKEHLGTIDVSSMEESAVLEQLRIPPAKLRRRMAETLTQTKFSVGYEDFLRSGKDWFDLDTHRQTLYEISSQNFEGDELILFGAASGEFLLYKFSGGEVWQCRDFAVIGSGTTVAEPILYQRKQDWTKSVQETLYSLYEAKKLAEVTPGVGDKTLVAMQFLSKPGRLQWLSARGLEILEHEFSTFGPKPYVAAEPQYGLDVYLDPDVFGQVVETVSNSSIVQT